MEIVFSILIAVVVSLGISIYFHEKDKKNVSMGKVKDYADKRTRELEQTYKTIADNYNNLIAGYKSYQDRATASIKILENKNNEFENKISLFEQNIKSVASIEKQINSYSAVLKDLNDMTNNVEENLIRLKKQSEIVDKLFAKVEKYEQNVETLDKKIPVISENFSKHNAEQLKAIGKTLLSEYEKYGNALVQKLEDSKTKANDILTYINQNIQNAYTNAASKVSSLENTAFEHLSKESQQRSEDYKNQLSIMEENLVSLLKTKISEIKNQMDQEYKAIQGVFDSKLKETTTNTDEALNASLQELTNLYTEKVKRIHDKYQEQLDSVGSKNDGIIAKIAQRFEEDFATISAKYQTQLEKLQSSGETNYNSIVEKFNSDYENFVQKYTAAFDSATAMNNKKINEFNETFVEKHKQLQEEYEQKMQELSNLTAQNLTSYQAQTSQQSSSIIEQLNSLNIDFTNQFDQLETEYKARLNELNDILAQCNQTTDSLRSDVNDNSQSLSLIQNDIDKQVQDIRQKYQTLYDEIVEEAQTKEKTILSQIQSDSEKNILEFSSDITNKIDSLRSNLSDNLSKVSTETNGLIHNAQVSIENLTQKYDDMNLKASELKPEIEAKIRQIASIIENFQNDAETRLSNMNQIITDSVKAAVEKSENKHLDVLEGIDERLSTYKKDIEYKLSQIENSGADIDTLEKSLRAAMQEIQNRVLSDFDSFTSEQHHRHQIFADNIKNEAEGIKERLQEIDNSLESLKATSSGSMSAKLQEFEQAFDNKLTEKSDKVDNQLSDWTFNFNKKLESITDKYENERNSLETHYLEELKTNILGIENKTKEQYSKVEEAIQQTKDSLENSVERIKTEIASLKSDSTSRINDISTEMNSELQHQIGVQKEKIDSTLNNLHESINEKALRFEEKISGMQESSSVTVQNALNDFNSWKQTIANQFEQSNSLFNDELSSFKENSVAKIDEIQQSLIQKMNEYSQQVSSEQDKLNQDINLLNNKTQESLETFKSMYQVMFNQADQKIKEQNAQIEDSLTELRQNISEAKEQNRTNQQDFVLRMQNESNTIQQKMTELARELNEIKNNIHDYERAEEMKRQLQNEMREISDSFERLDDYEDSVRKASVQFEAINKINNDLEKHLDNFENQRIKINSIEQQLGRLLALSNTVDERTKTLTDIGDNLSSMEVTVRDYNDRLSEMTQQYERLEKKDELVNRVLKDTDTSFTMLKDLETRLKDCARQITSLPQEIRDVQTNVDRLLKNGPKITEATSKLEELDTLLSETRKNIDIVNSANLGIKKTEQDLQELSRGVEKKFEVLHKITKEDLSSGNTPKDKSFTPSEKETIRDLKRQGWTINELASRFKRSITEIELLLDLPED